MAIIKLLLSLIGIGKEIRKVLQTDPVKKQKEREDAQKESEHKADTEDNTDGVFGGDKGFISRYLLLVLGCVVIVLVACAAKWKEPPSWTLREDGRLRRSQAKEDFSFEEWKAKYLSKEGKVYGLVVTPAGAQEIAKELARREARIIYLENQGCH